MPRGGVSCHASKVAKGVTIEEQREDWLEDNPLSERRPDLALAEEGCPEDLLALAARCWADDAHSRPTFAQCAQALAALASRKTGTFGDSDFRCVLKTQGACVGKAQGPANGQCWGCWVHHCRLAPQALLHHASLADHHGIAGVCVRFRSPFSYCIEWSICCMRLGTTACGLPLKPPSSYRECSLQGGTVRQHARVALRVFL